MSEVFDGWRKVVTCWQASGMKDLTAGERSSLAGRLQVLKMRQVRKGRHLLAGYRYGRSDSWGKVVTCWKAPGIKDQTVAERSSLAGRLQV
jgi:hypothetical protein